MLKTEWASQPFATRAQARTTIFEYIEVFVRPLVGIIGSGCIPLSDISARSSFEQQFYTIVDSTIWGKFQSRILPSKRTASWLRISS